MTAPMRERVLSKMFSHLSDICTTLLSPPLVNSASRRRVMMTMKDIHKGTIV
jgi:hypothetical protein